jgi:hypothetical protein
MHVERTSATSNLVDVVDRVLDKGIVIDAWVRVSLVGIELVTVAARVVVAAQAGYPVSTVGKSLAAWSTVQGVPPPRGVGSTVAAWTMMSTTSGRRSSGK